MLLKNGSFLHKENADHEIIEEIPTAHGHSIPTKVSWVHQAFDAFKHRSVFAKETF
jgi:hypothetical protein